MPQINHYHISLASNADATMWIRQHDYNEEKNPIRVHPRLKVLVIGFETAGLPVITIVNNSPITSDGRRGQFQ
jgi:hypothetical protein